MDFRRQLSQTPSGHNNDQSAESSAPSTPGKTHDEDADFFTEQKNESQSSLGAEDAGDDSSAPEPVSRPKPPVDGLPAELLIAIIGRLSSQQDLYNCLLVSKFWARCAVELLWHRPSFSTWDRLQVIASAVSKERPYWYYKDLIRRLNLSIVADKVNDGTVAPFEGCNRVERLTLTCCSNLTNQGVMGLIKNNRHLLALDITGISSITDWTMYTLSENCPRLQGLNITGCKNITDDPLIEVANKCKYLKRLKLNKCVLVKDEAIQTFAEKCPSMLEIDLQECRLITDASVIALIHGGRQLRELRLAQCNQITDNAFLSLPPTMKLDTLRILDLTACHKLTDAAVERIIDSAPRLRILVLAKCINLTDRAVMAITKLGKNLHDIHLGRCVSITDRALRELVKACNRIRYIDLAGCTLVTDDSVILLATLPKLRRIGLVKCSNISDASIKALARPLADPKDPGRAIVSNLERVHLSYCINITLEGIHTLLNSCPKITHLSLTGIQAFFLRDDLIKFCREAPPEFNDEQRQVFCVFSGEGVNKFRNYLNEEDTADNEADTEDSDRMVSSVYEDGRDRDDDGVVGMMESTAIEADDFDDE